jgi:hypothetical protein
MDVGVLADGSLHNPNCYPEADVRAAIQVAEELRQQRRCALSQKAAATRARRREKRVMEIARQVAAGHSIGPHYNCVICGKELGDSYNIRRGIGLDCWREVLMAIERAAPLP